MGRPETKAPALPGLTADATWTHHNGLLGRNATDPTQQIQRNAYLDAAQQASIKDFLWLSTGCSGRSWNCAADSWHPLGEMDAVSICWIRN